MTKDALRTRFRAARAAIPAVDRARRSAALCGRLAVDPAVAAAPVVHAYVAIGSEVDLGPWIEAQWQLGKAVALPRTVGASQMVFHLVHAWNALVPGPHGLREPKADAPLAPPPTVVLVPGLAFTADGFRLGQGAGYYDRFLAAHPSAATIGIAWKEQMTIRLPSEPHDRVMGRVLIG